MKTVKILRIVSGGQSGADRAGLDAAIEAGIPHGGYCPHGRRSEDGTIPERYQLKETSSSGYTKRTEMNIVMSDCTLLFVGSGKLSPGSAKTAMFAESVNKPCLLVPVANLSEGHLAGQIVDWFETMQKDELVVNVAGNRESVCPGISEKVKSIMGMVFSTMSKTRSHIEHVV